MDKVKERLTEVCNHVHLTEKYLTFHVFQLQHNPLAIVYGDKEHIWEVNAAAPDHSTN